jgi:hypothetical protein
LAGKGRTPKLNPQIQKAILDGIALGLPLGIVGDFVEVDSNTLQEWIRRGEGRDPDRPATPLYALFATAVKKARAADVARRVQRIEKAAKGGTVVYTKVTKKPDGTEIREEKISAPVWTADAWHLERTDPANWSGVGPRLAELERKMAELEKAGGLPGSTQRANGGDQDPPASGA